MKGLFNPAKINTVWALFAVVVLAAVVMFQVFIKQTDSDVARYVAYVFGIGLCVLIVILIYKFINKNPQVVRASGNGDVLANDYSRTFQQVDIVSVLSEVEERKKNLIEQENWGELQKIQILFQNLVEVSKQLNPDGNSRSLRDTRQLDLDKANRLLSELLTRIRK